MCGLGAVVSPRGNVSTSALESMSLSLRHRGPDDRGTWAEGGVGLCFRRLAIQDLSDLGHQPMCSPCGRFVIVFNGEIYNFHELRAELAEKGHTFRSRGDTEVLLGAFMEWGADCVHRLNGMWAFVVYDRQQEELTACRDHFGIKPLYITRCGQDVILCSEIKGIQAGGFGGTEVDYTTVAEHLLYGHLDASPATFWHSVEAVPPATILRIDARTGGTRTERFWDPASIDSDTPASAEQIAELFEDSVSLRLRSDVPVGVFLSGGMDSTAIICALSRQISTRQPLKAYAFMAKEFDERSYIDATLQHTGAELVPLAAGAADVWDRLPEMLAFQDEPVHSPAAIIGYLLSEAAGKEGTKVILNGQGADETFAGYPPYFSALRQSLLEGGLLLQLWQQSRSCAKHAQRSTATILLETLRIFVQSRLRHLTLYRRQAGLRRHRALMADPWFTRDLKAHAAEPEVQYEGRNLPAVLQRAVAKEPLPLYLRVEDRNSMAHSIEVRLPFLDHRLVETVLATPPNQKLCGEYNKHLLREAMAGKIPENVRTRRDKMGFPVPYTAWLRREWHDAVADILNSQACRERGLIDADHALSALARHRRGEANYAERLFESAQLELWLQQADQRRQQHPAPSHAAVISS